jgi:hypothetical protein
MTMYLYMNVLIYTGFYRLLPSLYFPTELLSGFGFEVIFIISMFLMQMLNNSDTVGELNAIQNNAIVCKSFLFLIFLFELIIISWEIVHNRKMNRLNVKGYKKKTEYDRRNRYS